MVFGLGWWSFTFPIGTMSLGLSAFGTTLDAAWLHGASAMVWIILSGTVALCLMHSVRLWTTVSGTPNPEIRRTPDHLPNG